MMHSGLKLRETALGLQVPLHILPRAKRCEISGLHNGSLKVRVTAPPVDDAANRAIVDLFSDFLHTSKSSISILAGLRSRDKILQIKGVSIQKFRERLARISGIVS